MPAGQRAAEAVAAHPEKSNRAIAEEIGPSEATVRRARDTGASVTQVDEKRIGRDGKTYSLEHGRKQVARLQKHYGDPASHSPLSALPPIADITESHWHVRFVPEADMHHAPIRWPLPESTRRNGQHGTPCLDTLRSICLSGPLPSFLSTG